MAVAKEEGVCFTEDLQQGERDLLHIRGSDPQCMGDGMLSGGLYHLGVAEAKGPAQW